MVKISLIARKGSEVANTLNYAKHHVGGFARMGNIEKFKKAYLHKLIPARADNDGVLRVGAEAHA